MSSGSEGPAPGMLGFALQLEDEARSLLREAAADNDWSLGCLGRSLAMLSVATRRLAVSGPLSHSAVERAFPDHSEHARRDEDPLAMHTAQLDLVGFLAVGDMVLNDAAAVVIEREKGAVTDAPWRDLCDLVDALAGREPKDPLCAPCGSSISCCGKRGTGSWRTV